MSKRASLLRFLRVNFRKRLEERERSAEDVDVLSRLG